MSSTPGSISQADLYGAVSPGASGSNLAPTDQTASGTIGSTTGKGPAMTWLVMVAVLVSIRFLYSRAK